MDASLLPARGLCACAVFALFAALVRSFAASAAPMLRPAQSRVDVLTYHGDNLRTGWNQNETQLTTANVNPSTFGLLTTVALDGRVDAEPLTVTQQNIDGRGVHDVVYVATNNDSVFALDAVSGATLWVRNFGTPVPDSFKSGDDNIFPVMGIVSTPVIDRGLGALFVVADTLQGSVDVFTLHALALNNGSDLVNPVVIQFSAPLKNGRIWTFDPKYHLQRPGLLEANGNVYVSFGSTGDARPETARGSIVAYTAQTLSPTAAGITDRLNQPRHA